MLNSKSIKAIKDGNIQFILQVPHNLVHNILTMESLLKINGYTVIISDIVPKKTIIITNRIENKPESVFKKELELFKKSFLSL